MGSGKYVAYYRVSTDRQKKSGLGLEAQREAVRNYLNGGKWSLIDEFTEAESGKRSDRPELAKALARCRNTGATLVVAKLDRLARNTQFLLTVVNDSGNAGVVFCDLPTIPEGPTGKFLLASMANVAELEAGLISQRTKAALKAAKARGVVLGCRNKKIARYAAQGALASAEARTEKSRKRAQDIIGDIRSIQASGAQSLRQIAAALNDRGITTPRGGEWSAVQVQRVLDRAAWEGK